MLYEVIQSNSKGNAVIYHGNIMVDCGIAFVTLRPYLKALQMIFISHQHADHLNTTTIKKVVSLRPGLRVAAGSFLREKLSFVKNLDIIKPGVWYNYGDFRVSPVKLYHDIPNYGIRIEKSGVKILHCTDTCHLQGIEAKGYDLYALEFNHDEVKINDKISMAKHEGRYSYEIRAKNNHLSEQQAIDFFARNKAAHSKILQLHESSRNL